MTGQLPRREIRQAGVAGVERHLEKLGLAPTYTVRGGVSYRTLPKGIGWCQALHAPEEAWPPGAELCVIVRWHPDRELRRDSRSGTVPAGAEAHWKDRTRATVLALISLGYQAAATGPPRGPRLHACEDILVWRLAPGAIEGWPPFQAWDGAAPARPNFDQPDYHYPERDPARLVEAALSPKLLGTVLVVSAEPVLWPAHAEMCVRVLWQPDPQFRRRPDGTVPVGADEHWTAGTARVHKDLEKAGFKVRQAERPTGPELDEGAGFLVWLPRA